MEQIERAGVSGQWVQYNQFTFKNVTSDLKKVEDPEMQQYFEDNCVILNPTPEERLEHWQPYFSGAALSSSPLMDLLIYLECSGLPLVSMAAAIPAEAEISS